jgi:hypothetical protein
LCRADYLEALRRALGLGKAVRACRISMIRRSERSALSGDVGGRAAIPVLFGSGSSMRLAFDHDSTSF